MADCVFCKIASGEIPSTKVLETPDLVAFRDIHPAAPVHVLVVPRKHVETADDLAPGDAELVGKMVLAAAEVARKEGVARDGYRLALNCRAAGGQEVFHLHLHLLGGRPMRKMGCGRGAQRRGIGNWKLGMGNGEWGINKNRKPSRQHPASVI
jgi:histidine triad (HIT) family protein